MNLKKKCKISGLFVVCVFFVSSMQAQDKVTIDQCLKAYETNVPYQLQFASIDDIEKVKLDLYQATLLPQTMVVGQGTYQSDVTGIPITIPGIQPLAKDQYRAYLEVNQSITDLLNKDKQRAVIRDQSVIEKSKNSVEIYKFKEQIVEIYFGILLSDRQLELFDLSKKQIGAGISKMDAALANGLTNKIQVELLKAELLKVEQSEDEILARKESLIQNLNVLTGLTLSKENDFETPFQINGFSEPRPEFALFDAQSRWLEDSEKLLDIKLQPRIGVFGQVGYGRPGLNMLSNNFDSYFIGGVRLMWSLNPFMTKKNDQQLIKLQHTGIQVQKEMFALGQKLKDGQIDGQINGLEKNIEKDDKIIQIKDAAVENAQRKLSLGTMDALDYIQYVNQADIAKQQAAIRAIQKTKFQFLKLYNSGL